MTIAVACAWRKLHVGRDWWPLLDELRERRPFEELWHGDGTGGDQGIAVWARAHGIKVEAFPAPWELFKAAGLNAKAAGRRRIVDMLSGRRGYDRDLDGDVTTTEELGERPDICIALPGHVGTRRTVQNAIAKGMHIERCYMEPLVVNRWHYQRVDKAMGRKWEELPEPHVSIQRGRSPLANPWTKDDIPDIKANLARYKAHLGDRLRAKDQAVLRALDGITRNHSLVCSCVTADGSVDEETGKGLCHGFAVVQAWHWWQRHRKGLEKYL